MCLTKAAADPACRIKGPTMKLARVVFLQSQSVVDLIGHVDGVHLRQLAPLTTLLVWTRNSLYRIVVMEGVDVYVQGGAFFPDPTPARLEGASMGGGLLKLGWIGVGLVMEIRAGGMHVVTSPVRAIATERQDIALAH